MQDKTALDYLSAFRKKDEQGIDAALSKASYFCELFKTSSNDPLLSDKYLNMFKVYENEDIWKITNSPENEKDTSIYVMPLEPDKKKKEGEAAITLGGIGSFKENWDLFTEKSLEGLDWNNVIVGGGSVMACLLPIPKIFHKNVHKIRDYYHNKSSFVSSDIDMYIYGLDEEAAKKKMLDIFTTFSKNVPFQVVCVRGKYSVNIVSKYPYRIIQIVLKPYKTPAELMAHIDIDSTRVCFDGKDVWAAPKTHQAFIKQCNIIDLSCRSASYEVRLAKYAERGFEIPGLRRDIINPIIYERKFSRLNGLARLLVLERLKTTDQRFYYTEKRREMSIRPPNPLGDQYQQRRRNRGQNLRINKFEMNDYEIVSIPYGPDFDAKKITKMIIAKDYSMNSKSSKIHRHPCFFGSMYQIFQDCCGLCPAETLATEEELQDIDKYFVKGELKFDNKFDNASFVQSYDEWISDAYIKSDNLKFYDAVAKGDIDYIRELIDKNIINKDIDVNEKDYLNRSPLHLAVLNGHLEIVDLLLKNGAKITAKMNDGRTSVHLASQHGHLDILDLLFKKNKLNEQLKNSKIQESKVDDDLDKSLEMLIYYPLDLCLLVYDQQIGMQIATILLENGATASQLDYNFNTVLHLATKRGHPNFVKLLLDTDPRAINVINLLNRLRESPLTHAIKVDNKELVDILLKYGAKAEISYEDLETDLKNKGELTSTTLFGGVKQNIFFSLENGIYKTLLESGASINCLYAPRETLLDYVQNQIYSCLDELTSFEISSRKSFRVEKKNLISLIKSEIQKLGENSYSSYTLSKADVDDLYKLITKKNINPYHGVGHLDSLKNLEKADEKLLERLKKLDECFLYIVGKGAKLYVELVMDEHYQKSLLDAYQKMLNYQKVLDTKIKQVEELIDQKSEITGNNNEELKLLEVKESILNKQIPIFKRVLNNQKGFSADISTHIQEVFKALDTTAPINNSNINNSLTKNNAEQKQSLDNYNIDEFFEPTIQDVNKYIFKYYYLSSFPKFGFIVPEFYYKDYFKLYEAVWNNDVSLVEELGKNLIICVQDNNKMTPFTLACYLGHDEMAIKILEISKNQYKHEAYEDDRKKNKLNLINNYDIEEYVDYSTCDENSESSDSVYYVNQRSNELDENLAEPPSEQQLLSGKNKIYFQPKFINITPLQLLKFSVYVVKKHINEYKSPKNKGYFVEDSKLISKSFDGITLAVTINNINVVKKLFDWIKSYELVENDNDEKGDIIINLIEEKDLMKYAIYYEYLDIMDLLIEYGAGGNYFTEFKLKREKIDYNEIIKIEKPNVYLGIEANKIKKRNWIINNHPALSTKPIDNNFLNYASFYGCDKSIEYLLSDRPINSLQKYFEINYDSKKLSSKNYDGFDINYASNGETPLFWAINRNKPNTCKKILELYKEKVDQVKFEKFINKRCDEKLKVSAFIYAALNASNECLKVLIDETSTDPEICDENGWNALHHAAYFGNLSTLKLLYKELDSNLFQRMLDKQSKKYSFTPIAIAILEGRKDTFNFLLSKNKSIENLLLKDFQSNNYLHLSIRESLFDTTKLIMNLIENYNEEKKSKENLNRLLYDENAFGLTPIELGVKNFVLKFNEEDIFDDKYKSFEEIDKLFDKDRNDYYYTLNTKKRIYDNRVNSYPNHFDSKEKELQRENFQPFKLYYYLASKYFSNYNDFMKKRYSVTLKEVSNFVDELTRIYNKEESSANGYNIGEHILPLSHINKYGNTYYL
ncbi:2114_t:CDS:10 [Entrophospora sp. SA101]|nr:2114_t:CDS:10 [Entrophospora sp. SA101]